MRSRRSHLGLGALVLAPVLVLAALVGWRQYRELERAVVAKFNGRPWAIPARVYADAFPLYPGIDLEQSGFFARAGRLGYREVDGPAHQRGEIARDPAGAHVDVFLRPFRYPLRDEPGRALRVQLTDGVVQGLRDLVTGAEVFDARLEPEPLTALYEGTWEARRVVALEELPSLLVNAVLAVEDSRFFAHGALDWRGVGRALVRNLRAGRIVEGGSTLTQQLMKNFFLSSERTLRRKATELVMAWIAERRYPKTRILGHYLNEIYLGQDGARGIFGVSEGAQFYFGREPSELTIGEIALLAGLIRAPNRYSPYRDLARAQARRDVVLDVMARRGLIGKDEAARVAAEPLHARAPVAERTRAPYFVDLVRRELAADYPDEDLATQGLRIFTALDAEMQVAAERALAAGLDELERAHPRLVRDRPGERLQGALVAVHPGTGEIKALVGGRDYATTQFNRVLDARRQPGSVFKPIVYFAAFEPVEGEPHLLPTSPLNDEPFSWRYDGRTWTPRNYGGRYLGAVTVREALAESLNAATARVAFTIGLPRIIATAERLGISGPLPALPAIVLGGIETTPLAVAEAYAVLASQGQRTAPRALKQVADEDGRLLEGRPLTVTSVVSPAVSYLVTHLLEGALEGGTGSAVRRLGFTRPAAGKTGTTNDAVDAWFVGYTPDLVAVVWVGYDRPQSLGLTGSQAALPIWTRFMREATAGRPVRAFDPPPGVTLVTIDAETGARATAGCPHTRIEAFLDEDAPVVPCVRHGARALWPAGERGGKGTTRQDGRDRGGWWRWWRRLF